MSKNNSNKILIVPLAIWIIIIPLIVKMKIFANPLTDFVWYSNEPYLSDMFLYYKSWWITGISILMMLLLFLNHQKIGNSIAQIKTFIPLLIYTLFVIISSLFSKYKYFCIHGMPEQFETIWNLIAYVIALLYCYYLVVYQSAEKQMLYCIYIGAAFIGLICVLQFLKIDIFRLIFSGEEYSFTFDAGTVYGTFYNTNYVGYYTLLVAPLFILLFLLINNWKIKIASAILAIALFIAMIGAKSSTAIIAFFAISAFAFIFLMSKRIKSKKGFVVLITSLLVIGICLSAISVPKINSYLQTCNTEKTDLGYIYTLDDCVEIDYKEEKLFVSMPQTNEGLILELTDQNQSEINIKYMESDEGYYYYEIIDDRFAGITLAPALISKDPDLYGFALFIDDKSWCFTNQLTDDGTYYYYTDLGKLTKLSSNTTSEDFEPLINKSNLASGRGYIWNKTIAMLKEYIFIGSGADTFAIVFPNDDFVDRYNNGYGSMIITKPHSLYLQIAVQTGVVSLCCFLFFYIWYFISSIKIYFRTPINNNPLVISGFAIFLGTLGYMISGLMNDSSITVAPLFWALLGMGIGINYKISHSE